MQLRPNSTCLEGTVRKIIRCSDGWGAEVEFVVERNLTPSPDQDFVRAKEGESVTLFAASPDELAEGARFQVQASRLAGPRGPGAQRGRVVIEAAKRLPS